MTNIKLNLGPVVFRKLIPGKYEAYLKSLGPDERQKKLFNSGELVFIASDCIIQSMTVEISLGKTSSTAIDASVGWSGNTVAAQVLDSAELGLKVTRHTEENTPLSSNTRSYLQDSPKNKKAEDILRPRHLQIIMNTPLWMAIK